MVCLVEYDLVRHAPEHLQRDARERDRTRVVDRAAARVRAGVRCRACRRPRGAASSCRRAAVRGGAGSRGSGARGPSARRTRPRRRADADSGRRAAASPDRPCCRRSRRRGCGLTRSHGSVAFATYCMFARSSIWPAQPHECSGSSRPVPSGLITPNTPACRQRRPRSARSRARRDAAPVRRDHERDRRVRCQARDRRGSATYAERAGPVVSPVADRPDPHLQGRCHADIVRRRHSSGRGCTHLRHGRCRVRTCGPPACKAGASPKAELTARGQTQLAHNGLEATAARAERRWPKTSSRRTLGQAT